VGINAFIADAERVHIVILKSTDLQPGICHDDPVISTSNSEHTMDSGSTTGLVIPLPGDISSKPPPSTSETVFYEAVSKKVTVANTSQRRMKELGSHNKRIPIVRPSGHIALLDRQVGNRKKGPLKVLTPLLVEINIGKKGGGLSKHTRTASSGEVSHLGPGRIHNSRTRYKYQLGRFPPSH